MRVPDSTYRLQFNSQFRLRDAQALLPYLEELGVSDVYSSPLLQARSGSTHGYDVTNPLRINPEIGSQQALDRLARDLRQRHMGLLLDIVPNHMAASSENPWYMDILEKGPYSRYAPFFDVDWRSRYSPLQGKILVPVLGITYGKALEKGQLVLNLDEHGFSVNYYGTRLPLAPATYGRVLSHQMDEFRKKAGPDHPAFREYRGLLRMVHRLADSPWTATETAVDDIRKGLWELYSKRPEARDFVDSNIHAFNGVEGDPRSFDLLEQLLLDQYFWLTYWRLANEQINYRRFFAISELISVRMEDQNVFEVTHSLIFRLIQEEKVTGLRIDHIDGLYDPARYLRALQRTIASFRGGPTPRRAANATPFYVVVEKVLDQSEEMRGHWPVSGTTGYDFLAKLNSIFVQPKGIADLSRGYARLTGQELDYRDLVYEKKKLIMHTMFAGEMSSLGDQLAHLAAQDRYARDLPPRELLAGLVEITACVPVYRTYTDRLRVERADAGVVEQAVQEAKRRNPAGSVHVFEFLRRLLLLEGAAQLQQDVALDRLNFLMRWQQFTGPITAKSVEDTAFFIYNRLISENEVGSDPAITGEPCNVFHRHMLSRRQHWPHSMNATTTHDTKRAEDVRARINVLSELPQLWERRAARWMRWNAPLKARVAGRPAPGVNDEFHLYQTMMGAWPLDRDETPAFKDRLCDYMLKAVREAQVHTRWLKPNPDYEATLRSFIERLFAPPQARFLNDFLRFARTVAFYGALNSLSQVLVKAGSPGVPDFYQGSELWDLRLVDPDNRRPVDFRKRIEMLGDLKQRAASSMAAIPGELMDHWQDGRIKLFVTWRALRFRKEHSRLFRDGDYVPLGIAGKWKDNLCAFARCIGEQWAVFAVPRLCTDLVSPGEWPVGKRVWGNTVIKLPEDAPRQWTNSLTGKSLKMLPKRRALLASDVFSNFPVALLVPAG